LLKEYPFGQVRIDVGGTLQFDNSHPGSVNRKCIFRPTSRYAIVCKGFAEVKQPYYYSNSTTSTLLDL
jgi:hypothetical protein